MPDTTITIIPTNDNALIFSWNKITPYKLPHIIWVKKNGLIMLLYLPAIWYAALKAHIEIITIIPELANKKNSFLDGSIGSFRKNMYEKRVKGMYW